MIMRSRTEILDLVANYIRDEDLLAGRGVPVDEIAEHFGISRLTAYQVLNALESLQMVKQCGGEFRLPKNRRPSWIRA